MENGPTNGLVLKPNSVLQRVTQQDEEEGEDKDSADLQNPSEETERCEETTAAPHNEPLLTGLPENLTASKDLVSGRITSASQAKAVVNRKKEAALAGLYSVIQSDMLAGQDKSRDGPDGLKTHKIKEQGNNEIALNIDGPKNSSSGLNSVDSNGLWIIKAGNPDSGDRTSLGCNLNAEGSFSSSGPREAELQSPDSVGPLLMKDTFGPNVLPLINIEGQICNTQVTTLSQIKYHRGVEVFSSKKFFHLKEPLFSHLREHDIHITILLKKAFISVLSIPSPTHYNEVFHDFNTIRKFLFNHLRSFGVSITWKLRRVLDLFFDGLSSTLSEKQAQNSIPSPPFQPSPLLTLPPARDEILGTCTLNQIDSTPSTKSQEPYEIESISFALDKIDIDEETW